MVGAPTLLLRESFALESGDHVGQALLGLFRFIEAGGGPAFGLPHLRERPFRAALDTLELGQLFRFLDPQVLELPQRLLELLLLQRDPRLQSAHVLDHAPVVQRDQVQVLVAADQIAEVLRAQQHAHRVQRPALVDRAQAAVQRRGAVFDALLR